MDHAAISIGENITMQLAKWPYILFLGRCYCSRLLRFWLRSRFALPEIGKVLLYAQLERGFRYGGSVAGTW